jgi:hypothetical protein
MPAPTRPRVRERGTSGRGRGDLSFTDSEVNFTLENRGDRRGRFLDSVDRALYRARLVVARAQCSAPPTTFSEGGNDADEEEGRTEGNEEGREADDEEKGLEEVARHFPGGLVRGRPPGP